MLKKSMWKMCCSQFPRYFNDNPYVYPLIEYNHQIGFIFDCLMINNIYYFLGKHFIHTSLIEALQFTLLPPLSILKSK